MFDFGAHTCRAGFAGEDTPKVTEHIIIIAYHSYSSKYTVLLACTPFMHHPVKQLICIFG